MTASVTGGAELAVSDTLTTHDDERAFYDALAFQEQKTLGASFARRCLSLCLGQNVALILSLALNGFLGWHLTHPNDHYFSTEQGRITPVYPLNQPAWSVADISQFGADTLTEAFTLDFVHYRNQMTRVMPRFDDDGYTGYYTALKTSNLLSMVRDQRMNLSIVVSPGVVHSKGLLNGIYTWTIQYPVVLQLDGQQTSQPPQRYIVQLLIQRADPREKPQGLVVRQTIMTNAN